VVIRRSWTREQKRELVWEGLNSGQSFSHFARQQGIHPSVMLRWLRKFAQPVLERSQALLPQFASVALVGSDLSGQERSNSGAAERPEGATRLEPNRIEIETPSGYRVRFVVGTDLGALRQVIASLEPAIC